MKAKLLIIVLILVCLFSIATVRVIYACGNQNPVALLAASPDKAVVGEEVTLYGTGSYDPDGTIVQCEWDVDYNEVTFTPEYTEYPGDKMAEHTYT
ncbi:MAG: hypothetical protein ACYS9Y_10660, partial [Planctomycetota bacterium]